MPETELRNWYGNYEFIVTLLMLTYAPETFMSRMNGGFKPLLNSFVMSFVNEICGYSESVEQHVHYLRNFLGALTKNKFCAIFSKFEFLLSSNAFLRHVISKEGFMVDT